MASLHTRITSKGLTWRVQYRVGGKQKVATFTSEEDALYWKTRFDVSPEGAEAAFAMSAEVPVDDPTVREIVGEHIDGLSGIRARTRADYTRDAENMIYPTLGNLPVSAVERTTVARWVNELERQQASPKTIANIHALLSAAFKTRVETGKGPKVNPCRGVRLPRGLPSAEMHCMSHSDFAVLLNEIPARWQPLVMFLPGSGLRWGEATALTVGDVDLESPRASVRVTKAVGRSEKGALFVGPTKTKRSRRTVRLAPEVAMAAATAAGGRAKDQLLFTTKTGAMVSHNNFYQRVWTPAMERLTKLGWMNPPRIHDLRHTFASWSLGAGVPITEVSRAMGHESIVTTVNVYGHLQAGSGDAIAQAISTALSPAVPQIEA